MDAFAAEPSAVPLSDSFLRSLQSSEDNRGTIVVAHPHYDNIDEAIHHEQEKEEQLKAKMLQLSQEMEQSIGN